MISNSVAVLPMNIVEVGMDSKRKIKHPLYQVLNGKPDVKMNHFQFMKIMVESLFLRGNAYAYIVRDEQLNVKNLIYLDANNVTPVIQDDGSVKYLVNGLPELVEAINMIHILQHPNEGVAGQVHPKTIPGQIRRSPGGHRLLLFGNLAQDAGWAMEHYPGVAQ